ncbi:MAG: UDP-glucose 4-epimerase GalE [Ruminococcaceae bacterium]|nr:UDP-glucose 4-epimerase GalE [Oscillospiraceae bacterium]
MKTILVAGGAGYIGSHMVALLVREGYEVLVADNLCTGHAAAVKGAKLLVGDVRDGAFLDEVFSRHKIDGVINFAAFSLVGESVTNPLKYYGNNVAGAQSLLEAMVRHGVDKIVFSSTAATYGEPEKQPIEETDRTEPTNPYGASKLAIEGMLKWCGKAYGIRYAALRYFNAAGADTAAEIGEDHHPESHLIPIVLQVALGKRERVGIFGDDYPTPDGTCVRDYIHVQDLARAHLLALEYLDRGGESGAFNLGSGTGYSVREIIETARTVTGRPIPAAVEPRRAGDPSVLIASNAKAQEVLGWQPERSLEQIVSDAWAWHSAHPEGYGDREK